MNKWMFPKNRTATIQPQKRQLDKMRRLAKGKHRVDHANGSMNGASSCERRQGWDG